MRVGKRLYGTTEVLIRTCGIVACENSDNTSCGKRLPAADNVLFEKIRLTGQYPVRNDTFYFPSTIKTDLQSIPNDQYSYEVFKDNDRVKIEMFTTVAQKSLVGFAIYGRDSPVNCVSYIKFNIFILLLTALLIWLNKS